MDTVPLTDKEYPAGGQLIYSDGSPNQSAANVIAIAQPWATDNAVRSDNCFTSILLPESYPAEK